MATNGPGAKGSRQNKRPTPLRMVKPEEVRQYRPPIIIHTYSPKVHHVDAAHFSTFVQNLTGRPGLKRKPDASPKIADDVSFASTSTSGTSDSGAVAGGAFAFSGLMSPRSPLTLFEDLKYQPGPFEDLKLQSGYEPSSSALSWGTDQTTNKFSNSALMPAGTPTTPGPQYSPLFSNSFPGRSFPHLFSPLPSPNFLSSDFMAELPVLSPSTYQHFNTFGTSSLALPSPGGYNFANSINKLWSNNRKAQ